jgi:hypothetical protein
MIPDKILDRILEKPDGAPRLVPVKEALRYGKFGLTKLYHLISDGKVDAYKDGHTTLIDLNSIDAYQRSLPRLVGRRSPRRRAR